MNENLPTQTSDTLRTLVRRLAQVEAALDDLAGEDGLGFSSLELEDGPAVYYDEDGNPRLEIGLQDDGRFAIKHKGGTPPPKPTAPDCTPVLAGVLVVYDGTFEDDEDAPSDLAYYEVHSSPTPDYDADDTNMVGTMYSPDGGTFVHGIATAHQTWYYSIVAVDWAGNASEKSDEVACQSGGIKGWAEDTLEVTFPGTQTMLLSYRPIPETEHLRWDGDSQPWAAFDRDEFEVTIPDPDGALKIGDILTMQYLYTDPTAYVPPAPALEFIGFRSVNSHFDEIALPDGTQEGDMLLLGGVHGFFGGSSIINTNDPRMTMTYQTLDDFGSHWHGMTAYGFADASGDPVLVTGDDPTSDCVALLATYRVVGVRHLLSTLEGGPCAPLLPSPADLGVMIVASDAGPGGAGLHHDFNGDWTRDAVDTSVSQCVSVWSCPTGTPDAYLVKADDTDVNIWAYLAIGLS